MAAKTFGFHLLEVFSVSNCGEKRRMRKKTWGGRGWEGSTRHLPPPFCSSSVLFKKKKKERRQRRLNFTQYSILNSHSLTHGISSCNFICLRLDNSNLTTRGNNTRHNIRVNRNWVGHVTWTDQWGLNYSETHWRACHRRLGQRERVGSHARYGGKILLLLPWLFICICSSKWWRLGFWWGVL